MRFGTVTALPPVSVTVEPGRALVVRGGNGSGKTTLLRCIAGRITPTSGRASVDDVRADERDPRIRERVSLLAGTVSMFRDLTWADHLVLVDSTWGRDPDTADERVLAALAELEVDQLAERFPHELSAGQSQLMQLSLALFRPSSLLLLDEPEQRLDEHRRHLVADLLAARRDSGVTLVVATHDPILEERIADDHLVLRGGTGDEAPDSAGDAAH